MYPHSVRDHVRGRLTFVLSASCGARDSMSGARWLAFARAASLRAAHLPSPSPSSCAHRSPTDQAGVGLIEVLVAVLILSIGFLGMAKLQSQALASANSAAAHQMGTVASYSMADAMRIDAEGVARGDYAGVSITVPDDPEDCASSGVGKGGPLAVRHQQDWCGQLALLAGPGTVGEIERLSGDQYRLVITFAEHAMADVDSRRLSTRVRL